MVDTSILIVARSWWANPGPRDGASGVSYHHSECVRAAAQGGKPSGQ